MKHIDDFSDERVLIEFVLLLKQTLDFLQVLVLLLLELLQLNDDVYEILQSLAATYQYLGAH
jgi:hypothetical protein